jgi:hypothetical protein
LRCVGNVDVEQDGHDGPRNPDGADA